MIYVPKVHTLMEGDLLPILGVTLLNPDGSVHDYTGASTYKLQIRLWPDGDVVIRNMVPDGLPSLGRLLYAWTATDWTAPGDSLKVGPIAHPLMALKAGQWEHIMTYKLDGKHTFPNGGYDILRILPKIA